MHIIVLKWIWVEIKQLFFNIKKEVNSYFKNSFLNYLKNLLLGKNKKWISVFFRIFFFGFIFRLIFDISKIIFRFYFIIMFWFFSNLKFSLKFLTFNDFWIQFNSDIIDIIQYFFLFIPFVRINEKLKKRKKTLYVYLIERSIDYIIRLMWWRPKLRAKLATSIEVVEFLLIFFGLIPSKLFVEILTFLIADFLDILYNHYKRWRLYFGIIHHVWEYNRIAGTAYLRYGASLFHIALMLQKQGFEAPKSTTFDKFRAKLEYKDYRRKYKKAELMPETLNDATIDVYVFLLELFSETRYELKRLPIVEFFFIVFPYEILYNIFMFVFYFYLGLCYILIFILFPIIIIYLSFGISYEILKSLENLYFLFRHDIDFLAIQKDIIWTKIREDAQKNVKKRWYHRIFNFFKKIINILK